MLPPSHSLSTEHGCVRRFQQHFVGIAVTGPGLTGLGVAGGGTSMGAGCRASPLAGWAAMALGSAVASGTAAGLALHSSGMTPP